MKDLPAGFYRLRTDWVNPSPDKRTRYDWTKQPVVKAGTRFECYDYPVSASAVQRVISLQGNHGRSLWPGDKRYADFANLLEQDNLNPAEYLESKDIHLGTLVNRLVENGYVSLEILEILGKDDET